MANQHHKHSWIKSGARTKIEGKLSLTSSIKLFLEICMISTVSQHIMITASLRAPNHTQMEHRIQNPRAYRVCHIIYHTFFNKC